MPQTQYGAVLVVLQAKISASTVALREALIEQQQGQQAAIASLVVLPGCNRTVDMQYVFVVGLHKSPVFRTSSNFAEVSSTLCIVFTNTVAVCTTSYFAHAQTHDCSGLIVW